MNALRLTLLLVFLLPVTGCLDNGADTSDPGSAAEPAALRRVTIYSQDITIDSTKENEPIAIVVPDDSVAVFLDLRYGDGVYNEANFSLGECQNVTPASGVVVDAAGQHVSVGSYNTNKVFECGDVPSGPQQVEWQIEHGMVKVKLVVHADVPA